MLFVGELVAVKQGIDALADVVFNLDIDAGFSFLILVSIIPTRVSVVLLHDSQNLFHQFFVRPNFHHLAISISFISQLGKGNLKAKGVP